MCRRRVALSLVVWALAACARAAEPLIIGVVDSPPRLLWLAAGVEAGLGGAGTVQLEPVEPDEPLAPPGCVCGAAAKNVAAAVAGGDARALRLAADAAARAAVPLLLVDDAPAAGADWEALQLYPHSDVLAEAAVALCQAKGWKRAVLLHEGSARGAALLAGGDDLPTTEQPELALLARQLPEDVDSLRNLLLVLKKSGSTHFIVWCSAECAVRVLDAAQRVGLLAERHSYIVLALDLHTQALEDYSHGGANVTALRLFDPEETANATAEWRRQFARFEEGTGLDAGEAQRLQDAPPSSLPLVMLGAELVRSAWIALDLKEMPGTDCTDGRGAFHADTLLNYLRSEEWSPALGGAVWWEADGARRAVALQVVELHRGGLLAHAGRWSPTAGLTWERDEPPAQEPPPDSMVNRTFTVLIALNEPYVMIRESKDRLSGNQRYEGFCIELIDELANLLGFNYTFVLNGDSDYGSFSKEKNAWTGMLGKLMDEKEGIDFAITDLTITAERERAVDFTTPFMNLGISILFRAPTKPQPKLFAFMLPFSNDVWLCLGFAYLATSLLLYVVGRLCHEEWQNPYPCLEEPDALENQFTLGNALWFNLGAMLLQGSEIAPVAYSTRAVASVWWLFALVITSSYTANLATLLALKSSDQLFSSVQELADNDLGIDYGAKINGSTYTFFQHSQNALFQKMFRYMSNRTQPDTNDIGVQRVRDEERYAFLMESTTIEYKIERYCDITMVGSLLDSKGYGIAMKKNSTYRQALNLGLLSLQENGKLREMKRTWWKDRHGGGVCTPTEGHDNEELKMMNFLGLFLVLVVGCALGVVLSCCDLAWASLRRSRLTGERFHHRFWAELRFVFRFDQSVKPVQGPLSESSCGSAGASDGAGSERSDGAPDAAEDDADGADGADAADGRRSSARSACAWRGRRRSSMHAASLRLARHAQAARNSGTPAPY